MITRNALPPTYKPYSQLVICSNLLLGGGHLLAIGDVLPLVVGSGPQPMVWLQAPASPEAKDFILLIDASVSRHPGVAVVNGTDGLVVKVGTTTVLRINQSTSEAAVIDLLDLRPISLNIFGSASALHAGGASFSNNSFSGIGTLIAFGDESPTKGDPVPHTH